MVIYPNDHRPAHVHVIGGGREAVFKLKFLAGLSNFGKTTDHLIKLSSEWERIHEIE